MTTHAKAGKALLAGAEKMICAVEADPALLFGPFGDFLRVLLDEIRSLFGPSDLLDSLLARVRIVRVENLCPPAGALAGVVQRRRNKPK
jgi:hypothetical protein